MINVKNLKPGDRFAGVVESVYKNTSTADELPRLEIILGGNVLNGYSIELPPGTEMFVGQLGQFEYAGACSCGQVDCDTAFKVNLCEDEHTW